MTVHPCDSLDLAQLRARPGAKWNYFEADVLPLWVAEMDFPLAEPMKQAIRLRLDNDDLGYGTFEGLPGLKEAVVERMAARFGYRTTTACVVAQPSTVTSMNLAARALAGPGDEIILPTPLYPPFKREIELAGRVPVEVEMSYGEDGYRFDFAAMEAAVTPATRMLMICSPHNPVGRVFERAELEQVADFVLRHNLWLLSDELHADLVFAGNHRAIAGLSPEIASRTITLYGPTKAFNLPGLQISFVLASNPALLARLDAASGGLVHGPNVLAQQAALAAFEMCDGWLSETLDYLRTNRDYLSEFVVSRLPQVSLFAPQGTYLAWLDFRRAGLGDEPAKALKDLAKVGLNEGAAFGKGGAGFARLNFATSRAILDEGLERITKALA